MNRRELVSVVGGLVASTGCLDRATTDESDGDDGRPDSDEAIGAATEPPFEVHTVDAPGSDAGTITVPPSEPVAVVNFTRTRCPTSSGLLETVDAARQQLADEYDVGEDGTVRFLSVTDGTQGPNPTDDELADWWREHDGEWTIGTDEAGALNDYYDVVGFPTTVVIDDEGEVHWRERGTVGDGTIVSNVERALEESAGDDS
ncbi:TlpA family protein disulfide reductase [Natronobacterium texcoconense]|uniref:Redoxin n=1 Tax=Natronobacterium texcoconense TaxID=1095778 RepID=A0A1H1A873_NATTX|nr:redoxin family protein [Natronobacterium texcoconense]SDQ35834.1 Redoxin [Natronobacterium texcoconense]